MKQIQWFPGHMAKAKREIIEKLKLVDIVFEIVDARLPYSSKNPIVDEIIKEKPHLIILNKSNLADAKETTKWLNYYNQNQIKAIDVDAIDNKNINKIISTSKLILESKINHNLKRGIKNTVIRAMILGIPNVGKSTLINTLVKKKVTNTGDKPGVTKSQQWIKVNQELELLDTPGILWPKFDSPTVALNLALSGAIKDDILPKDEIVLYAFHFFLKNYRNELLSRYDLEEVTEESNLYQLIAQRRNTYLSKQEIDYERVNNLVLSDIRTKKLGRVTFDRYDELISL